MKLEIISPTSSKEVIVDWLEIDTLKGNLVIQHGHGPAYIVVKPKSDVKWGLATGAIEKIAVENAFVEVKREGAVLILDRE